MIDIKELRLGNIIFAPGLFHKCYAKVIMIGKEDETRKDRIAFTPLNEKVHNGVKYKLGMCVSDLDQFNPIPIDDEILGKFGFKKDLYCKSYEKDCLFSTPDDCLFLYKKDDKYRFFRELLVAPGTCDWRCIEVNAYWVEYVHQLQNIFYVLSGQELDVKL